MRIEERKNLQPLNTLGVPSVARFFARATTEQELRQALRWAQKQQKPVWILGGGSNALLPEKINGLVIQPALRGVSLVEETERHFRVRAACGENWHRFVQWSLAHGYAGLENLTAIPGLVGAAPIQNIGAYGVEQKDYFCSLRALNRSTGEIVEFSLEACEFGYRDSVFKRRLKDQFVIVSVDFKLSKTPLLNLDYPALKDALRGLRRSMMSPQIVAHTVATLRREKLPDPANLPNCGSFFKNPVVAQSVVDELKHLYPDIVAFPLDGGVTKVAAGWLIEKSGWKGREVFDIKVHDQQALVLTNPKKAPAKNVLKLAASIQSSVRQRYGIELELEPQWLGVE